MGTIFKYFSQKQLIDIIDLVAPFDTADLYNMTLPYLSVTVKQRLDNKTCTAALLAAAKVLLYPVYREVPDNVKALRLFMLKVQHSQSATLIKIDATDTYNTLR